MSFFCSIRSTIRENVPGPRVRARRGIQDLIADLGACKYKLEKDGCGFRGQARRCDLDSNRNMFLFCSGHKQSRTMRLKAPFPPSTCVEHNPAMYNTIKGL